MKVLLAYKIGIIIAILSAILATVGGLARNSIQEKAMIEEALKPMPQPPPMTQREIDQMAQKPMRPGILP